MLPSGLLLVSHSVDTEVLFSEIKNQMTVTATNNYDYVNETCSPSFNRNENGKKKPPTKYHNTGTAPNSNGKPT
jgi:hypothetical protein